MVVAAAAAAPALGLLDGPFMGAGGSGFPSLTGGAAAPSSADANNSGGNDIQNGGTFTIATNGASTSSSGSSTNLLLAGVAVLAIVIGLRK